MCLKRYMASYKNIITNHTLWIALLYRGILGQFHTLCAFLQLEDNFKYIDGNRIFLKLNPTFRPLQSHTLSRYTNKFIFEIRFIS